MSLEKSFSEDLQQSLDVAKQDLKINFPVLQKNDSAIRSG
jgi:hypothetical protein